MKMHSLKPRKGLAIWLLVTFLSALAFQMSPVWGPVPNVVSIVPWTSGTDTILNITVTHSPFSVPSHYVDTVEVDIGGTVDSVVTSQSAATFIVQYNMGTVMENVSVRARAYCNMHGWSTWSPPETVSVQGWPKFRHDLRNTGYTHEVGPKTNLTAWEFDTGSAVTSSPAVVDGVVYVGSNDTYVYALNATTGTRIWNYTISGQYGWNGTYSSPAVADGVVYIGSNDFNVYALNATTGDKIWNFTVFGYLYSSPTVVDGVVYVGGTDSFVYALNATTQPLTREDRLLWNTTVGLWNSIGGWVIHGITSSPAVVDGVVYVGSASNSTPKTGNVTALDAETGDIIWMYPLVGPSDTGIWFSSPAIVNDTLYIGTWDGWVLALNATTESLTPAQRRLWGFKAQNLAATSPAVAYGLVYMGELGFPSRVLALNASTGVLEWFYGGRLDDFFTGVFCSPAVSDGIVYTGTNNGIVLALNAMTGSEIWRYAVGNSLRGSAVVAEDGEGRVRLFVGGHNRKVHAFGLGIWDINADEVVNIVDIVIVALAFDSTPGDDNWNPDADIAEVFGVVNIVDIVLVAIHFDDST